jgi:putative SOS response-associated peptidase YedK
MPAILAEADYEAWLTGSAREAKATLQTYPEELMAAYQVSRRVNGPKLPNDASLIEPL